MDLATLRRIAWLCLSQEELVLPEPEVDEDFRQRPAYLIHQRGLSAIILASLIDEGQLYADTRGNAVFVMMAGKPNRPIGAELRGTGRRVWRGLAPGTCKNTGFFWIGDPGAQHIVLCESAIDATLLRMDG